MKKIFITQLLGCLLTTLLLQSALSQSSNQLPQDYAKANPNVPGISTNDNTNTGPGINSRVMLSFQKSFKGAQDVCWTTNGKRNLALFRMGDRNALALFTKNGNIVHSILYGTEKHLPAAEKKLLEEIYPGYEIINVQQVNKSGEIVWIALLQNCTKIIKVQLMEGELYEMQNITRSK